MKTVIILYMPGHAGNFVSRLFSLGAETMPLMQKTIMNQHVKEGSDVSGTFDKLGNYLFSSVKQKFGTWQQFHAEWADHQDRANYRLLNVFCNLRYSRIVFPLHPHEFAKNFEQSDNDEFYHVDLDLNTWGHWVETSRQSLGFVDRPGESDQFAQFKQHHQMQPISLTKLLDSEELFVEEYQRVCYQMKIIADVEAALELRRDWYSTRVTGMTYVISRPPNDDFTYPWFKQLISQINGNVESYYLWSGTPTTVCQFFQHARCRSPLVIVGVKDLLDIMGTFNWWHDPHQSGSVLIREFAQRHPNTKIILFTSMENLHTELQEPNLHIIPWGGDWLNQQAEYRALTPVLDKNFSSDRTFICLNRGVRPHRLIALSYLFGGGYQDHGVISYLDDPLGKPQVLLDRVSWVFGADHDDIRAQILGGFDLMNEHSVFQDDTFDIYQTYGKIKNDNAGNFKNRLRTMYQDSFVEIVNETTFAESSFLITEKTAHAFYGCNFPIILGGCGIIAHLRGLGLDVFDDVIDHTYDQIDNPFDRIVTAIDSNRQLLTNPEYVKQTWIGCRSRFEHNVQTVRTIHGWYARRAKQKLAETLELIS
jgi:hypothetical protein